MGLPSRVKPRSGQVDTEGEDFVRSGYVQYRETGYLSFYDH